MIFGVKENCPIQTFEGGVEYGDMILMDII